MNVLFAVVIIAIIAGVIWALWPRSKNATKGPKRGGGGADNDGPSGPIADQ